MTATGTNRHMNARLNACIDWRKFNRRASLMASLQY